MYSAGRPGWKRESLDCVIYRFKLRELARIAEHYCADPILLSALNLNAQINRFNLLGSKACMPLYRDTSLLGFKCGTYVALTFLLCG
jgi:hypothetical protein